MNVYDWDKTVFDGDAEDYFFAYLFRDGKYPWNHLVYDVMEWMCSRKLIGKTAARTAMYRVLRRIPDLDALLEAYWDEHEKYVLDWYRKAMRPDDVIATGTPRFLMEPMLRRLGLTGLTSFAINEKKRNSIMQTEVLDAYDPEAIAKAAAILRDGGVSNLNMKNGPVHIWVEGDRLYVWGQEDVSPDFETSEEGIRSKTCKEHEITEIFAE